MRVETYTNTFIRNHDKLMISRQRQKLNTRHNKRDKETLEDYYEVSQQSYVFQRQIVNVGLTKICLKIEKNIVLNN